MTIKIPVQASFDGASVEQQLQAFRQKLNTLGQQIAQANKVQFNPISKTTLDDLRKVNQQFEALRRVSGDLNKRINATGQKGRGFVDIDWAQLYPDAASRARQMSKAFQYVTGVGFGGGIPPVRSPGGGGGGGSGASFAQAGLNAAQAGLRATNGVTGGAGGVAANALGTGASAGIGAGLMGLLGGMLALGVGKFVSAATEKIGQAEDNAVAYDRIKRTLGDVNVSFTGLKTALEGAASNVKVTFDEAARLGMQFAKMGNMSAGQYGSLPDELRAGVGMARSLGLDPSQGVGFLGTMRGMRQTRDADDSRRMALLIGETIAKSNAFAKSDEVMDAISNYVSMQTRASFGANVRGYAGMFSSMVGSGIPGMDPAGAAGMLGRINASLMAGGAKGEASQFFTAMVGNEMGLNPLQMQLLRESGAFATKDSVFGAGSVYGRAGLSGPRGRSTLYDATRSMLRRAYPGQDENSVLMRANATGNHLGISMTQALALEGLNGNQMGDLEGMLKKSGLKIGDINMGGLAALSKVVSGSGQDRLGVAAELWGRTGKDALTPEQRAQLDRVMKTGTESEQKELLTTLVASRDQEMTQGKDIRDSKTALENIQTTLADHLLPVTQAMRDGIMWMAGGKDGKSSRTIRRNMAEAEINEQYAGQFRALEEEAEGIKSPGGPFSAFSNGPAQTEYINKLKSVRDRIAALNAKKQGDLNKAYGLIDASAAAGSGRVDSPVITPEGWRAGGGAGAAPAAGSLDEKLAAAERQNGLPAGLLRSVMRQETGGRTSEFLEDPSKYHYGLDANGRRVAPHTGKISTAFGPFGILESTGRDPGYGVSPLKDKSLDEQIRFAAEYSAARIRRSGSVRAGMAGYGEGDKYANSVLSRLPAGTPMPEDAALERRRQIEQERQMSFRLDIPPLDVIHRGSDGRIVMPGQQLQPRLTPMWPTTRN